MPIGSVSRQTLFTQTWDYTIKLSGTSGPDGTAMDLTGAKASEKIFSLPGGLGSYPPCTNGPPDPSKIKDFSFNPGNIFTDTYGYDDPIPIPSGPYLALSQQVLLCVNDLRQHYHLYACEIPGRPRTIDIQLNVSNPGVLSVFRGEVNDVNSP
jgi:hypothetical protein